MKTRLSIQALIVATALSGCASSGTTTAQMPAPAPGERDLRQGMRKVWADHVVWTRNYIIAAVSDQGDATAALNRLMKNQEDIGKAIVPYYGAAAGTRLTTL